MKRNAESEATRRSPAMNTAARHRRRAWPLVALAAVLSLVVLVPQIAHTMGARSPLWTDRPLPTPVASTAAAPNWPAIAKALKPAVVNISAKRPAEASSGPGPLGEHDPFDDFFGQFFGNRRPRPVRSLGSGFIVNPAGYIVTNNHVVDGAVEVRVKLSDGRDLPAQIAGRDSKTDLALLRIDASGLTAIPLGDSAQLQVGEPVMAIGNPFGLEQTVTTGIVSATGRVIGEGPYDDFIQTDASINPGNSGGPLISARGQAVGINSAIFSQSGGSVGIGFAIPINLAKSVVTQLADSGHVVRGWLGVAIQPITPELARSFHLAMAAGALVSSVTEGSPAAKAGVKRGDVITAFDGRTVARSEDLPRAVAETSVGRRVAIAVVRDGGPLQLEATIGRLEEREIVAAASSAGTGSLGLSVQSLTPAVARELGIDQARGVLVREVQDGSRAEAAGLRAGDVITEVDRRPVASAGDLRRAVERHAKGAPLLLLVHRETASLFLTLDV
jgi:serine protease Do